MMSNCFPALQKSQRIEVYLQDGEIKEGRFSKWFTVEGARYLVVEQDERIEENKHISGVWWVSEKSIKLIYSL